MKKFTTIFATFLMLISISFSQKKVPVQRFIIAGGIGAGAVGSTNIINSGAVLPSSMDLLFQKKRVQIGFGFGSELYITPESLGRLVLGQNPGAKKFYFMYEWRVLPYFPVNIGWSSQLGLSSFGGDIQTGDGARGGLFANTGVVAEIGTPGFALFVRPYIEYKSYSGFNKEFMAAAQVGLRFKILTDQEKARIAQKREKRRKK